MATYPSNLHHLGEQAKARALDQAKRNLARRLSPPVPGLQNRQPVLTRRWAQVASLASNGTASIILDGKNISAVGSLASYVPAVGDTVIVDFLGSDPVIIGKLATAQRIPPILRAQQSGQLSIANAVDSVTIVCANVLEDNYLGYNATTGVYTFPVAGLYVVNASIAFSPNAAGIMFLMIGGVGHSGPRMNMSAMNTPGLNRSLLVRASAGGQISATVYQSTGGALLTSGENQDTYFQVAKIAD